MNSKDTSIIDITDDIGNNWKLKPEIVNDRDTSDSECIRTGIRYWLPSLSYQCLDNAVTEQIIHKGE